MERENWSASLQRDLEDCRHATGTVEECVILSEALHHLVRGEAKNLHMDQKDSSVAPPPAGLPQNDKVTFPTSFSACQIMLMLFDIKS
jgi:hypothetical protein